ncbi:MAG: hypothetical protein RR365_13610 [Bacteroides sp.]
MPNRPNESAWERQKSESPQAYEAFVTYRDLGAGRSTAKVGRQLGKSATLMERWSSAHGWVERARQYDNYLDGESRREAVKRVKEMTGRQIKIALQLQQKAIEALGALDLDAMSPKDIKEFIKTATELERTNRREEAQLDKAIVETTNKEAPASLANTIMDAYSRRMKGGNGNGD